jgi:hypothetical protein
MATLTAADVANTLYSALTTQAIVALAPGGVSPNRIAQEDPRPAIVYSIPPTTPGRNLGGRSSYIQSTCLIQIGGDTPESVQSVYDAVLLELETYRGGKAAPNGKILAVGFPSDSIDAEDAADGGDNFVEKQAVTIEVTVVAG